MNSLVELRDSFVTYFLDNKERYLLVVCKAYNYFVNVKDLRVMLTSTPDIETPMVSDIIWVWTQNQKYPSL